MTVESEDDFVDQYDRFIMTKPNGSVSRYNIGDKKVESKIESVLLQCERLCLESRQREREAVGTGFGVRLGKPKVGLRCFCEQFGIYDLEGNHLFDIYAIQDADGETLPFQTEFTTRRLASLLALKLERDIPEQFRAKIQMDDKTRLALAGRLDFAKEILTADNGVSLNYGGTKNFNTDVTFILESDSSVRVTFTEEGGGTGEAIFNLKDGSLSSVPESK